VIAYSFSILGTKEQMRAQGDICRVLHMRKQFSEYRVIHCVDVARQNNRGVGKGRDDGAIWKTAPFGGLREGPSHSAPWVGWYPAFSSAMQGAGGVCARQRFKPFQPKEYGRCQRFEPAGNCDFVVRSSDGERRG
jgi:hypothetical protein